MNAPSIRRSLLVRCGLGVGAILCALSGAAYFLVRHSLIREIDRSINDTAALLSNQVELENGQVTFEWQEGLGTNDSLTLEGIFQFWDESTGKAARSWEAFDVIVAIGLSFRSKIGMGLLLASTKVPPASSASAPTAPG